MDLSDIPEEAARGRLRPLCGPRGGRMRLEPQQSLVQGGEEDARLDRQHASSWVVNGRAELEDRSWNRQVSVVRGRRLFPARKRCRRAGSGPRCDEERIGNQA